MDMKYDLYAIIISALSFVVAGIALGWNIFRDCVNRPSLKVNIFIADWYIPERGNQPQVVSVNITNTGKQAIVVKGHGFHLRDKTHCLFPDAMHLFNNKKLEPYDFIDITLPNEMLERLVTKADEILEFVVFDTTGKKWKPQPKVMKEFISSLKQKKVVAPT